MAKRNNSKSKSLSSAGHRLGQAVGDWWETKVIYPFLCEVAESLDLFLDNRVVARSCRAGKVQWTDSEKNIVDYDYVFELGGSLNVRGVPVAFLESFWRGGGRHSKDKARDDTNKLLPMRDTFPTARFLAIAACGEFTEPARDYVRSRNLELFFISKEKIIEALLTVDVNIDYPDTLPEEEKMELVKELNLKFTDENQIVAATNLRGIAGFGAFASFKQRILGALTATPQEIRICSLARFGPVVFDTIEKAEAYLGESIQVFPSNSEVTQYEYEVTFSDGSEFSRALGTIEEVRAVNTELLQLVQHFSKFAIA